MGVMMVKYISILFLLLVSCKSNLLATDVVAQTDISIEITEVEGLTRVKFVDAAGYDRMEYTDKETSYKTKFSCGQTYIVEIFSLGLNKISIKEGIKEVFKEECRTGLDCNLIYTGVNE